MKKQPDYRINLRRYRILYFPLLLPVALLIALFNKLSPVPFKIHALRVERIGQMAGNQEELLCLLEQDKLPREFRVYVHRDVPSNNVLMAMQKRVMPIKQIFLPLFDVCHKFGGLGVSSTEYTQLNGRDDDHLMMDSGQHFDLSREEEAAAREEFRALGLDPDKPFVTVLGRDSAYLSKLGEPTDEDSYRNVDINTFVPALESIADDYQVVRMGSVVRDRLNTTHPNILDYSFSGKRTELLDVYLSARCAFFITCGSGPDGIAAYNFRIPTLYVNYLPPMYTPPLRAWALFILKKYWDLDRKRYLSLEELLERGLERMCTPRELTPHRIEVHDNSAEEILQAVREMAARVEKRWETSDKDKELQRRYWNRFKAHYPGIRHAAAIGSDYIRNNPFWLD